MLGVAPCSSINVRMRIVHRPSAQETTWSVEVDWRSSPMAAATPAPDRLCDVGPATPATELEGNQLGELGRNV
jgi:hypothetical protein